MSRFSDLEMFLVPYDADGSVRDTLEVHRAAESRVGLVRGVTSLRPVAPRGAAAPCLG